MACILTASKTALDKGGVSPFEGHLAETLNQSKEVTGDSERKCNDVQEMDVGKNAVSSIQVQMASSVSSDRDINLEVCRSLDNSKDKPSDYTDHITEFHDQVAGRSPSLVQGVNQSFALDGVRTASSINRDQPNTLDNDLETDSKAVICDTEEEELEEATLAYDHDPNTPSNADDGNMEGTLAYESKSGAAAVSPCENECGDHEDGEAMQDEEKDCGADAPALGNGEDAMLDSEEADRPAGTR